MKVLKYENLYKETKSKAKLPSLFVCLFACFSVMNVGLLQMQWVWIIVCPRYDKVCTVPIWNMFKNGTRCSIWNMFQEGSRFKAARKTCKSWVHHFLLPGWRGLNLFDHKRARTSLRVRALSKHMWELPLYYDF